MSNSFVGRDFITTQEWSKDDLNQALHISRELKEQRRKRISHRLLLDKTVFLFFFDKSTRTRNSFEAGITQLGGHAHFLEAVGLVSFCSLATSSFMQMGWQHPRNLHQSPP